MNTTFFQAYDKVTVAVAFDAHTLPLVEIGASMARKAGKKLCLLHVVEPWAELPRSRAFGEQSPLWDVTQAVDRGARDLAQTRLEELAAMAAPDGAVQTVVVAGKPAERIGAVAQEIGSCVVLVGADYGSMRFLPRGFSTALSLMVTSPVPILVVDTAETRLDAERPAVLLADDLSDDAEPAVAFAFDLATACGSSLSHVHVNGLTLEGLRAGLESAAAAARTQLGVAESAADLHAALAMRIEEQLQARADVFRDYLEAAGGSYEVDVRTGSVQAELGAVVEERRPDLLVFGRQRAPQARPFHLGRLPFRAMLAYRRPLVVVPG